jgi:glycosyltransferase involved in cell wall biosynthesis
VAAWALQALREDFDVSLATLESLDYEALNRSWGTSLRPGDVRVHIAPPRYQMLLRCFPTPGALLESCLNMRLARHLDRVDRFDVLFSTQNEADFGRRGLQYIHYPWLYTPRPKHEMRWYHYIPGVLTAYRRTCQWLSGGTNDGLSRNLSLANSSFIAGRIRDVHGTGSIILFPPVTGDFPEVPCSERQVAMVGVGRMHRCKRWEMAVAIVDEVRRRGIDLGLTVVGHRDDGEYFQQLDALAAKRPWFKLRLNLTRAELASTVASHRYGIHTMEDEHFGMGPAEIIRAGCLLFAHNSGGPVEILAGERRLLFDNVDDAADKIVRVLADAAQEDELRSAVAKLARRFSDVVFCESLREIVQGLDSLGGVPDAAALSPELSQTLRGKEGVSADLGTA